jgi:hypothetical protein
LNELKPMLKAFKFNSLFTDSAGNQIDELTLKAFKSEFKHCLSSKTGELIKDTDPSDIIVRFDLIREIFLERGL